MSDRRLIELEHQVQCLMEAHLAPTQPTQVNRITTPCEIYSGPHDTQYCMEDPEQAFVKYASSRIDGMRKKRLSNLRTQLEQQQDDMISKINLLWKAVSEKLDDTPLCDTAGGLTAKMNFTSTDYHTKEELRTKEESSVEPSKTNYTNHKNANETDEEVESKKEVNKETKRETEEEEEDNPEHFNTFPTMKELRYHEWIFKNPQPLWVKAKIKTGNVHYNWIMSNKLEPRRKPSNPKKNCNFVGRVKGLRVFIRNFTYECNFMVLKDTTSVIDHYLGSVVFLKPFVEATRLVYHKEEGTVMFERDKEWIIFKIPHKMDMFKHVDFTGRGTNSTPPFVLKSVDDNCEKTHYSNSLDLGPVYKYDEYECRGIRSLMAAKARRKNK
ncbi:hypothetical protein Tco_0492054 [Tanacetum coccineum]